MKGFLLSILAVTAAVVAMGEDIPVTPAQAAFFEARIRPVLVQKCYGCHSAGAEKVGGELLLDTREGIRRGGASGPAVVPGDLMASLLISAVRWHDPEKGMPPQNKGGKLPASVIASFEQWVIMGAPDPRVGPATAGQIILGASAPASRAGAGQSASGPAVPRLPAVAPPVRQQGKRLWLNGR